MTDQSVPATKADLNDLRASTEELEASNTVLRSSNERIEKSVKRVEKSVQKLARSLHDLGKSMDRRFHHVHTGTDRVLDVRDNMDEKLTDTLASQKRRIKRLERCVGIVS